MENKETKNLKFLVTAIIAIVSVIVVGTFAWLTYRSNNTAMVLTIGEMDGLSVTLKPYQVTASLTPTNDYTTQDYVNVTAQNKKTTAESFKLYYSIESIDPNLVSTGFKYTIVKSTDNWSSQTAVKTGNFSTASNGQYMEIYTESVPGNNTTYKYKVYLWIDSSNGNQSLMQGKIFKGELRAEIPACHEPTSSPSLDSGMIPVTISDTGVVTSVSAGDSNWYNYCEKKWANAVLVKENGVKTRSANKVAGTTINPNDILAYFVWVPRYSYKVWQYSGIASTPQEREIDIKFVNTNIKELATGNGQWYTHPAFTFGNEELTGIWVGKFETSTDTTDTCYATPSTTNCVYSNVSPRIVPAVDALRLQDISNEFQTALKFAGGSMTNNVISFAGSTTYGLTTITDSHMMKNSEWGAVAYLSHSKYGINANIRKNNYKNSNRTSTGCGANSANANTTTTVTTCAIPYGTPSNETYTYPQSTTGNISGIFDMSGGNWEYVMAVYEDAVSSSGFASTWLTTTGNSKYYNLYDSSVFTGNSTACFTACTLASCGGQALNETYLWYTSSDYFADDDESWVDRGGRTDSDSATAFYASSDDGDGYSQSSFRSVLVNLGN